MKSVQKIKEQMLDCLCKVTCTYPKHTSAIKALALLWNHCAVALVTLAGASVSAASVTTCHKKLFFFSCFEERLLIMCFDAL